MLQLRKKSTKLYFSKAKACKANTSLNSITTLSGSLVIAPKDVANYIYSFYSTLYFLSTPDPRGGAEVGGGEARGGGEGAYAWGQGAVGEGAQGEGGGGEVAEDGVVVGLGLGLLYR